MKPNRRIEHSLTDYYRALDRRKILQVELVSIQVRIKELVSMLNSDLLIPSQGVAVISETPASHSQPGNPTHRAAVAYVKEKEKLEEQLVRLRLDELTHTQEIQEMNYQCAGIEIALQYLTQEKCEILEGRYHYRKSFKQLSIPLNIEESTVRDRITAALESLAGYAAYFQRV